MEEQLQEKYLKGEVLLIDKPLTWTSFDVVNKIRYTLKKALQLKKLKVGHAGTLDPLATGLLILCTGKFTKKIEEFQAQEKEYTGTITLGGTTPSFDLETEVDHEFPTEHITKELLETTAKSFVGEQKQVAPMHSAKKINGKRAYEYARKGEEVEIKANIITIKEFEITNIDLPMVDFRIVCAKGTYIRSIARDFGKAVNSGGHLTKLRRTRIGNYKVEDAVGVEEVLPANIVK